MYILTTNDLQLLQLRNIFTLTSFQFGFIPKSGTEIACIKLIQSICGYPRQTFFLASAICINLKKKAFDMVRRKILINKIPTMNVNNQVLTSLASFLSNRLQYVLVKNKKIKYSVVLQR